MHQILYTREAIDDLKAMRAFDSKAVIEGIENHLFHEPMKVSRNRKRPRPNHLAEWELRVGQFRVFYGVDPAQEVVQVVAIGYKVGNTLYVHGERCDL